MSLDVAGRSPEQTLGKELDLTASWGRGWRADVLIRPGMIPEALKAGASPREKLREMETEAKGTMKRKVSQGERSKREVAVRVGRRRWRMGLSQAVQNKVGGFSLLHWSSASQRPQRLSGTGGAIPWATFMKPSC